MFQRSFAGEPLQLHGSSIGGHTVAVSESRRSRIESDTVIEKETNVRDVCVEPNPNINFTRVISEIFYYYAQGRIVYANNVPSYVVSL